MYSVLLRSVGNDDIRDQTRFHREFLHEERNPSKEGSRNNPTDIRGALSIRVPKLLIWRAFWDKCQPYRSHNSVHLVHRL